MRHLSKPWREVLAFFLHYDISLWSPGTLRVYVSTLGWTRVEISGHEAASFSVDIFRGHQRPKCLAWHAKESLTKPSRLRSSAQSREEQAFPLAMSHKVSLRNAQAEIRFYQPNRSTPLLTHALFLVIWQRRHGEWARDKATKGQVKEHPRVGWIIKATESHFLFVAPGCRLCKGRPTWKGQGAGTTDNRSSKQESGILPTPCLVFALQVWDTPTPQHCCLTPVPAVAAHGLV